MLPENWTVFMTLASKNMGPYRPVRHNCWAQFRPWYLSSTEAGVANNWGSASEGKTGVGRAKSGSLWSTVTSVDFWEAKCIGSAPCSVSARPNLGVGGGDSNHSSGCFWIWKSSLYTYQPAGGSLQGILFKTIISFSFTMYVFLQKAWMLSHALSLCFRAISTCDTIISALSHNLGFMMNCLFLSLWGPFRH